MTGEDGQKSKEGKSDGSSTSESTRAASKVSSSDAAARTRADPGSQAITRARTVTASRGSTVTGSASPARSRPAVSTSDDPARDGVRLGVIAYTTAASVVGMTALGAIAAHIGADTWIGGGTIPRSIGELFVTGIRLPLAMVRALYASGVDDPLFFGASMALLIPPIAALAAARPIRPGGPRASTAVINAGRLGAVLVVAGSIGIAIRLFSLSRPTIMDADPDGVWLDRLHGLAATNTVAMTLAILLAVLIFRLPVDRWVRALGGTLAIGAAVAATVTAAASAGIVDEVERAHPLLALDDRDAGDDRLLLGITGDGLQLTLGAGTPARVTIGPSTSGVVVDRTSIVDRLDATVRSMPTAPGSSVGSASDSTPDQTPPDPRP